MTNPTVSPAGMRVMRLLVGKPPQTVAELTDAACVTRTAVAEQLNELLEAGFVHRGTERLAGRGRPRHVYSATKASLTVLFANHHHLLVPAIWKAVDRAGGDELIEEVLREVSRQLAEHYTRAITAKDPGKRLDQFAQLLCAEGAMVDLAEENGRVLLHKRSCPFISMLDDDRRVCCVDQAMIAEVIGRPVRRIGYRLDGAPCCTFEIETHG